MDTHSSAHIADDHADHISTIPPEVALEIADYLSLREVIRMRLLSKHWRNVVDTNAANLLKPAIAKNKARIRKDYTTLLCTGSLD